MPSVVCSRCIIEITIKKCALKYFLSTLLSQIAIVSMLTVKVLQLVSVRLSFSLIWFNLTFREWTTNSQPQGQRDRFSGGREYFFTRKFDVPLPQFPSPGYATAHKLFPFRGVYVSCGRRLAVWSFALPLRKAERLKNKQPLLFCFPKRFTNHTYLLAYLSRIEWHYNMCSVTAFSLALNAGHRLNASVKLHRRCRRRGCSCSCRVFVGVVSRGRWNTTPRHQRRRPPRGAVTPAKDARQNIWRRREEYWRSFKWLEIPCSFNAPHTMLSRS